MSTTQNQPTMLDVTDWIEKQYISTGGTRDKSFLESPDGEGYFFKTSLRKPGKDYKFEFWSEIIAFRLGSMLNLNMLQYDVAIKGDMIGCISKSMITQEKERLTEGVNYLVGYDNSYDPNSKTQKHLYSYQYIKDALRMFKLERFLENIDEIIVFDALIGNGDRHQENWAIISEYTGISKKLKMDATDPGNSLKRYIFKMIDSLLSSKKPVEDLPPKPNKKSETVILQAFLENNVRFAPIYDNGSSLGREHDDVKLELILNDKQRLDNYLDKGEAEIHWQGRKLKHWELIKELLNTSEKVKLTIENINSTFNEQEVRKMVFNVDNGVPEKFKDYKLTDTRKEFITKMITLRHHKLAGL